MRAIVPPAVALAMLLTTASQSRASEAVSGACPDALGKPEQRQSCGPQPSTMTTAERLHALIARGYARLQAGDFDAALETYGLASKGLARARTLIDGKRWLPRSPSGKLPRMSGEKGA